MSADDPNPNANTDADVVWRPGGSHNRTCKGCGAHVSAEFKRVMAADGDVYGCPQCTSGASIRRDGVHTTTDQEDTQ